MKSKKINRDKLIRMRINYADDISCDVCNNPKTKSLELFDLMLGNDIICICDLCVNTLFSKTLKASTSLNAKLKTPRDMKIIRGRHINNI